MDLQNPPLPAEHNLGAQVDFDCVADLALVRAVLEGEIAAVAPFNERMRCVPRILGYLNSRLGRPLDAEDLADVAQDVSLLVVRKLHDYEGRGRFEGWIYRLCNLEILNAVRRRSRQRRRFMPLADPQETVDQGGARQAETLEKRERLLLAIQRVGGVEAELLTLKHFENLTFDDIAARLGIPANTAKTRYYRGLDRLHQILSADGPSSDC